MDPVKFSLLQNHTHKKKSTWSSVRITVVSHLLPAKRYKCFTSKCYGLLNTTARVYAIQGKKKLDSCYQLNMLVVEQQNEINSSQKEKGNNGFAKTAECKFNWKIKGLKTPSLDSPVVNIHIYLPTFFSFFPFIFLSILFFFFI